MVCFVVFFSVIESLSWSNIFYGPPNWIFKSFTTCLWRLPYSSWRTTFSGLSKQSWSNAQQYIHSNHLIQICDEDKLLAEATEWATTLSNKPNFALSMTKFTHRFAVLSALKGTLYKMEAKRKGAPEKRRKVGKGWREEGTSQKEWCFYPLSLD